MQKRLDTMLGGRDGVHQRTRGRFFRTLAVVRWLGAAAVFLPAGAIFGGLACSDNHDTPTSGPAERALGDPSHYKPRFDNTDTDITGGDIGHYDKKAMKRDLDDLFNP